MDLSHRAPSGRQARCRAPWHRSGRHMWPPSTPQGRDLSRNGGGWIGSAPRRWHCVGHERGGCKGPCPSPACSTGAQQDLQVHATIPGPKSSGVSRPLSGPRDFRLGPHPAKKRFRGGLPQQRIRRNLTFPRRFTVPFRSDNAGSHPVTPLTPGRGPGRNRECLADEPWRRGAARGRRTSAAPRALRFLIQMLYDYARRRPGHPETDEPTSKTRRLPFKKFMLTLCYSLSALEIKRRTMAGSFPALRGKPKW